MTAIFYREREQVHHHVMHFYPNVVVRSILSLQCPQQHFTNVSLWWNSYAKSFGNRCKIFNGANP